MQDASDKYSYRVVNDDVSHFWHISKYSQKAEASARLNDC